MRLDVLMLQQNNTMLQHQQQSPACFSGVEHFAVLLTSACCNIFMGNIMSEMFQPAFFSALLLL
jgi:hypothetical protein